MKKKLALVTMLVIAGVVFFTGCAGTGNETEAPVASDTAEVPTGVIHVITREDGSGTRDAFVNVTGIYEGGVDRTWEEALVSTGTGAVLTSVGDNPLAMGYISLGALREGVRAVPVNGVSASVDTVRDRSYPLFRSFYMAIPAEPSDLAQDFINFVLSAEGQAVIAGKGFISPIENLEPFTGGGLTGTLGIEGSTSVAPLMNAVATAYTALFDGVTVDVHSTGSGAGITAAIDGRVDIGLSSRSLRDTELAKVDSITMAHDGLAVIVHPSNPLANITVDEVRDIFIGELTRWEALN